MEGPGGSGLAREAHNPDGSGLMTPREGQGFAPRRWLEAFGWRVEGICKLQILNLKHQTLNPESSEQVKISMAAAKKKPKLQMDAKVPPTPIYT